MNVVEITPKKIKYNDGTTITFNHTQDCCEYVYANFESLIDTDIKSVTIEEIEIEGIKDSGFRLNGYFVPCYNEQKGYYSSDLELIINYPNKKKVKKDISEFVKDNIY